MNILITRTKRKKTISILIKDGNVEVKAPFNLKQNEIDGFILKKEKWIKNKILLQKKIKQLPKKKFIDGEVFKFLGKDLILKININDVIRTYIKNDYICLDLKNNSKNNRDKIKKELELFYRSFSEKILKEKTLIESKKMNLKVEKIKVRSYKNRWGSCSSNGDISYNWKLIMAPEKIINYVIIHELCHLIHFNHSRDYWKEVSKKLPNYRESKEWLKSNQYLFDW
jgi:predicted metal-dependent hydrolase